MPLYRPIVKFSDYDLMSNCFCGSNSLEHSSTIIGFLSQILLNTCPINNDDYNNKKRLGRVQQYVENN